MGFRLGIRARLSVGLGRRKYEQFWVCVTYLDWERVRVEADEGCHPEQAYASGLVEGWRGLGEGYQQGVYIRVAYVHVHMQIRFREVNMYITRMHVSLYGQR